MTEENVEEKEKVEETKTTPEEEQPTKTDTTPEPCDPSTMTCGEMRDHIIDLTGKRTQYVDSIEKLEDIKTVLPSDDLDKTLNDAKTKIGQVDDEIYNSFERFMTCGKKEENKEPEQ